MPRPPKLNLAAIVASASPPGRAAPARPQTAEIVALDRGAPPPRRAAPTLKERARQMSVYLEPPVYDQLRDLAFAERSKMHALMLEALDLLFKQRGARSIEQLSDDPPR
ncbi:ribbon-helix-helix domain-containing protein [Methylobacterium trifolii]|uniref:Antitoxin-like ribbon-helix-helix domain-containing protein n=1 Tax=Methylobacterium trifolii TaxID=1003092 RepID=A0ABQ4U1G5_9HYPH|nr:ribbon-helix-helix domain-containing protein [Methylobacterium trifolii]GJE60992.1 hypothetical protein MPOCJGCO_3111 [Methylobacterium trifolii]